MVSDDPTINDVRSSSRIPYPSLQNLSPAKHARVFGPERRPLLNVSRMAMHASDGLWQAQASLGRATIDAAFDPRLREMVILRVAHLQRSAYEVFHHRALAAAAGVNEPELAALLGGELAGFGAAERALIDFTDGVVLDVSPSDAAVAGIRRHFTDQFVFDVVVLIGSYMMTARIAAVGGVEAEKRPVTRL